MIVSTNNGATAESGARALDILIPLRYSVIEKTRPVCETEREESLYEPVAKPDFGAMPNSAAQTKQSVTSNVPIENPRKG